MFDKKIYIERRSQLKKILGSGIAFFTGNNNTPFNYPKNCYPFRQDSSFLYYFGIDKPGFSGIIDIDNNNDYLVGDDIDIEDIIWTGNLPSVKDLASLSGINKTMTFSQLITFLQNHNSFMSLPQYRKEHFDILSQISSATIQPSEKLIKAVVSMRSVKDSLELKEMAISAEIGYNMHIAGLKMCKPGLFEYQGAAVMESVALSYGGVVSFPIIFSQKGQVLHNEDRSNKLQQGNLVLIDAGAENNQHYASDFTRTIPVGGKLNNCQSDIYIAVLNTLNNAIKRIKPVVKYLDIHLEACKDIVSQLKEIGIFKGDIDEIVAQGAHAIVFPHGLGHMLGLDVHDMEGLGENFVGYSNDVKRSNQFGTAYLRMAKQLLPGNVITVEPGIYFIPQLIEKWKAENKFTDFINYSKLANYYNFGGIRLEDNVVVTSNGAEFTGKRLPLLLSEIEEVYGNS